MLRGYWTALHQAKNADTAKLLVECVKECKRDEFIWTTSDVFTMTALDAAMTKDAYDVVEYLCSITPADFLIANGEKPLSQTALHLAQSVDTAKTLMNSVPLKRQEKFLLYPDSTGQTILHIAVSRNNRCLVEYLCSFGVTELLLCQDKYLCTPLHNASSASVVELLFKALPKDKHEELIFTANDEFQTALHTIVANDKTEVEAVRLVLLKTLSRVNDLLCTTDILRRTALFYARSEEISQELIDRSSNVIEYLTHTDREGRTALHYSPAVEILDVLLDAAEDQNLFYAKLTDDDGRSALYYASSPEIVENLVDAVDCDLENLTGLDNYGFTPAMHLTKLGRDKELESLLGRLQESLPEEQFHSSLLNKNTLGQNIVHLACMLPFPEVTLEVILDFVDLQNIPDFLQVDSFNNSPLMYLAARFVTGLFADLLLRLPPWNRNVQLLRKNNENFDCRTILNQRRFLEKNCLQKVLCNKSVISHFELFEQILRPGMELDLAEAIHSPEIFFKYDENIFRVMKYALNEYSLPEIHLPLVMHQTTMYESSLAHSDITPQVIDAFQIMSLFRVYSIQLAYSN